MRRTRPTLARFRRVTDHAVMMMDTLPARRAGGLLAFSLAALLTARDAHASLADEIQKRDEADATAAKYDPPIATPSPIMDHFAVRASFVNGSVRTQAQITDPTLATVGTPFNGEQDLGLPSRSRQARAEFMFRLHNRGRLRVSAMDLSRSGSVILNRTIQYGGQSFQANERVNTQFDWRQFDLTWLFSFLRSDRFELGTGIGFHFIQTEVAAVAPARASSRQSYTGSGPFATLALDATWRMTRRFSLNARGQTFDVTASSVSAKLFDWHADVQFRAHKNLAIGAGYQSNYARLDIADRNPGGNLRFTVAGPELFLRASF
jgi:hypothetical protein